MRTPARGATLVLVLVLLVPATPQAAAAGEGALTELALDGAGRFIVGWRIVETEHVFDGRLDEGASRLLKLTVAQRNVTDASFTLRWRETEDDSRLTEPDHFELDVGRPDGSSIPGSPSASRAGVLRVGTGTLNEVPPMIEFEARSLRDALAIVDRHAGAAGTGTWPVSIRLLDVGNPAGAKVDTGNAYALTVLVRHYEPVITRAVSLEPPPSLSMVQAAKTTPTPWLWSAGALAVAALSLGAWLAADAYRRRRN